MPTSKLAQHFLTDKETHSFPYTHGPGMLKYITLGVLSHPAPCISALAMNPADCAEVNSRHMEGKTINCLLAWNICNKAKSSLYPKVHQLLLRRKI